MKSLSVGQNLCRWACRVIDHCFANDHPPTVIICRSTEGTVIRRRLFAQGPKASLRCPAIQTALSCDERALNAGCTFPRQDRLLQGRRGVGRTAAQLLQWERPPRAAHRGVLARRDADVLRAGVWPHGDVRRVVLCKLQCVGETTVPLLQRDLA